MNSESRTPKLIDYKNKSGLTYKQISARIPSCDVARTCFNIKNSRGTLDWFLHVAEFLEMPIADAIDEWRAGRGSEKKTGITKKPRITE
jgi:hypothetical protein